uniref:Uncharacterized protein n=1 Tax=Panagrolaimus sp. PS1159 TaxID=55785 RepID=A0AC35FEM4_9BILA
MKRVFKLYLNNWINGLCGRVFYTAYDITKNRTNNHPEVHHSRQRLIYDKYRMPLGEWLIQFREMTNSEDYEVIVIRLYQIFRDGENGDPHSGFPAGKSGKRGGCNPIKKYLRKIGGYLKSFDLLEGKEAAGEEEYLTAFEEPDDEDVE